MKAFILLLSMTVLTACATTSKFDAKIQTWKGQDAQTLVKAWGQPDSIEPLHTGDKMYVYARLKREPVAANSSPSSNLAVGTPPRNPSSVAGVYIKCAAYFDVDQRNIIVHTDYRGDECVSSD